MSAPMESVRVGQRIWRNDRNGGLLRERNFSYTESHSLLKGTPDQDHIYSDPIAIEHVRG